LAGEEIKQAAGVAACMSSDERHLPWEQNPALLSCCQDFLAIELFSSGAKGGIDGIDSCQALSDGRQHLLF
jgi:hypothetical protein